MTMIFLLSISIFLCVLLLLVPVSVSSFVPTTTTKISILQQQHHLLLQQSHDTPAIVLFYKSDQMRHRPGGGRYQKYSLQQLKRFPVHRSAAPSTPWRPRTAHHHGNQKSSSALSLSLTTSLSSIQQGVSSSSSSSSYCLTALLLLSTFGITLERRTTVGKALSAPLATMALALLVANVGLIPFSSPVYSMINTKIVPLAVPMLLFDSDLRKVWRNTGSLLLAFGLGAVATVIGTLGAYPLLCLKSASAATYEGYKVACALAARHIGGAINFVAVAETLNIAGTAVSATIAADNVVVALYFMFLFAISKPGEDDDNNNNVAVTSTLATDSSNAATATTSSVSVRDPESVTDDDTDGKIDLGTIAMAMTISSVLVTAGGALTQLILPPGTSALPLTSTLTVLSATAWPMFFSKLCSSGTALGILGIQMFFAASGAAGSISLVLQQAPMLFLFSLAQIAIHFVVLMGLGRGIPFLRRRLPLRELYVASNANIGGPTTAAAMAQAKEWKRLVVPGLLVGILGYATATPIALGLAPLLLRWTP